ncbi:hypothetical protein D3093_34055 (plasmid) [Azospirillum argentinense]|uniref:Uncharacterized protein n=1 Tax=Azospirillum argentinense TaxID=2970906 RepID=A0A4D8PSH1_9PROT|nr:hypothetical protein [Azospirillum argentinense]QCO00261.1 hypothetical protein D3093_34055 [Azospirillum argentinense]
MDQRQPMMRRRSVPPVLENTGHTSVGWPGIGQHQGDIRDMDIRNNGDETGQEDDRPSGGTLMDRPRQGRGRPSKNREEDADKEVMGIDLDGDEPADGRERAVYRTSRRVRKLVDELAQFRDTLRQARDDQRKAMDELQAERDRRRDAHRLQAAALCEDVGISADLLLRLAAAKRAGDAQLVADLTRQLVG